MRFLTQITVFIFFPILLSCNETLVGSDPANTPQNNFQILWDDFDRYYSLFEVKNVDWHDLYDIYAPQVTDQTDDRALFDIMSSILTHLNDGHVDLTAPFRYFNSRHENERRDGTLNLDIMKSKYLSSGFQTTGNFTFGPISDVLYYLHIASFSGGTSDTWVEAIDFILNELFDYSGLIIDIRANSGGNALFAEAIAGRFIDHKTVYILYQARNGLRHSDFGPIRERYLEPAGIKQFTKPIIVLTDRRTASAAEIFILAMKRFSHIRVIGDVTSGSMTPTMSRQLPNGWVYKISIGKLFSADHVIYEGIGIPPDIHIAVSPSDEIKEKDMVIEIAIQLLND